MNEPIEPVEDGERADSATEPVPGTPRGVFWEMVSCAVPLTVLLGFVFLAMWGYRLVFSPGKPVPVEGGEVQSLALHRGAGKEHDGQLRRLYPVGRHRDGRRAVVLIPRPRAVAPPRPAVKPDATANSPTRFQSKRGQHYRSGTPGGGLRRPPPQAGAPRRIGCTRGRVRRTAHVRLSRARDSVPG